jgi:glycosyltransferase involved in cell wall biosynthesis
MKPSLLFLDQQSWRGGGQRVLQEVIAAFEKETFRLIVALPADGPFARDLRGNGVETLAYPLGHYRSGRKSLREAFILFFRSIYCGLRLARRIRRENVKLVYINGPRCLLAGAFAARLTRRPCIFHLHNIMTRKAELLLAAAACRYVQVILACSQAAASALTSRQPSLSPKIRMIWNPVAPIPNAGVPRSRNPIATEVHPGKTIAMVGRITRQKGQHVLLRAARYLSWQYKPLRIIFVGGPAPDSPEDKAYFQELQSYARRRCPGVDVRWEGFHAEVGPFLAACDAAVVASTESEGLGLAALEALQHGVPVVGSRVGGLPEIIRDGMNGFLVPAGDGRALADALHHLLSDAELHERLSRGARLTVDERFSPHGFHQTLRHIVADLLHPPTARKESDAEKVEATA